MTSSHAASGASTNSERFAKSKRSPETPPTLSTAARMGRSSLGQSIFGTTSRKVGIATAECAGISAAAEPHAVPQEVAHALASGASEALSVEEGMVNFELMAGLDFL
jgi:hypothetical protein